MSLPSKRVREEFRFRRCRSNWPIVAGRLGARPDQRLVDLITGD
jgi:hypothetical protein